MKWSPNVHSYSLVCWNSWKTRLLFASCVQAAAPVKGQKGLRGWAVQKGLIEICLCMQKSQGQPETADPTDLQAGRIVRWCWVLLWQHEQHPMNTSDFHYRVQLGEFGESRLMRLHFLSRAIVKTLPVEEPIATNYLSTYIDKSIGWRARKHFVWRAECSSIGGHQRRKKILDLLSVAMIFITQIVDHTLHSPPSTSRVLERSLNATKVVRSNGMYCVTDQVLRFHSSKVASHERN